MRLRAWAMIVGVVVFAGEALGQHGEVATKSSIERGSSVERGRDAARGRPALNPPLWTRAAWDNLWKQWGLKEKPADFDRLLRERYGLHAAPYDNGDLPMGLHESRGLFGKGIVNDCLLCHAGVVAGQTVIGVGNASMDLQSLMDDVYAGGGFPIKVPVHFSHARGTIDPVSPVAFLMEFRDADLNLIAPRKLDYFDHLASDPPAWWLLKKKKTRNWTGGVDARSVRVDMINLLTPFNGPDYIKKQEPVFADIHAFIMSVAAPRFPFAVDDKLAAQGRTIFNDTCSRCHGTYGEGGKYPNKIVPLDTIGTDPLLARSLSLAKTIDFYNKSWFAQEKGPDGQLWSRTTEAVGYQAPPLDGIWATAPYFHNSSVPTVYHVLNSKSRPKYYTRSYQTAKEDYDPARLGWKIQTLDTPPDPNLPPHQRRRIYDATLPGRTNVGHPFGDDLSEAERMAVIEYLKTL